jgi:diguanylate cyclase (GGDEF)-like protein
MMKHPNNYSERVNHFYDNPGEDGQDDLELADGRFVHRYTVTLTAPDGQYLGRAWYYRDVTEERAALAQAVRTARLDPLTGLANRVAFVEDLQAAIAAHTDTGRAFAILYMDLDHFKDVNDALGHPAGDDLVRAVAQRLTAACRLTDLIARFGGDEFAVIAMDVATEAAASNLATHLIEVISEPYVVRGVPVRISASVGIALRTAGDADADTMLSQADLALYSAKAQGRSAHRAFTREMDTEVRTRLALGAELHQAIEADDLFLLYQPQIELGSRRVVGVEALVRWRHPERGVLSPDLFIPVAEQTGCIGKLGHWVTTTACRQAAAWLHEGAPSVRMAINVSSLQFKSPLAFETDIEDALAQSGLPPACLELELTETVLMNAFKGNENPLWRLRERGLTLAIDDFGTGYSSLDYLRRFPVDRIKIAQNFVRDLESSPGDAAIVKATIGLARELKIDVIAEGVERPRQLELLQAWGCTEAQGYLISRPLPADQIPPLLLGDDPLKAVA